MAPRVSFVMIGRNAERHVGAAVASVLEQTYSDLELVFVDDASTDATAAVVQMFDDRRIRIVHGPGRGLCSAHNVGLAVASGEFVARLDADDLAEPERTRLQLEYLDAHPEVVVVGSWTKLIDDEGAPLGLLRVPSSVSDVEATLESGRNPFLHPTVMFRAEQARQMRGYDARLDGVTGEDGEFLHRLCRLGRGANLPAPLVRYRLSRGAVSNGYALLNSRAQRRREQVMRRIWAGTDEPDDRRIALSIAAAARAVNPELAYTYRVGKTILQSGEHPRRAIHYLARAWRMRPSSPRVVKNLILAVCLAMVGSLHPGPMDPES